MVFVLIWLLKIHISDTVIPYPVTAMLKLMQSVHQSAYRTSFPFNNMTCLGPPRQLFASCILVNQKLMEAHGGMKAEQF